MPITDFLSPNRIDTKRRSPVSFLENVKGGRQILPLESPVGVSGRVTMPQPIDLLTPRYQEKLKGIQKQEPITGREEEVYRIFNELQTWEGVLKSDWNKLSPKEQKILLRPGQEVTTREGTGVPEKERHVHATYPREIYYAESGRPRPLIDYPIIEVGGVPISAPDIVALGLLTYGGYEVLAKGLPAAYQSLMRSVTRRTLPKAAAEYGIKLEPETVNNLMETMVQKAKPSFMVKENLRWMFRKSPKGITASPQAQKVAEEYVTSLVKQASQQLTKFTPGGSAVPGQTQSLAGIISGMVSTQTPTVEAVQAGRMELKQPTLADIPTPNELFVNKTAVEAMTKAYREGNPAIMERPIAVRRTPEGYSIIEGHNRALAAKKAGVEPPIVVLTEKQVGGLNASQVDALARKIYNQEIKGVKPTQPTPQDIVPTSVQTGLPGMERPARMEAFAEFGTAPGMGGTKPGLIDVGKLKVAEAAKPLESKPEGILERVVRETPITPEPPQPPPEAVQPVSEGITQPTWYRGTTKEPMKGQDTFWTSDESVAGDYGTAKVGEGARITTLKPEDMPKKVYEATNKETIAQQLGITIDPYRGSKGKFDEAVKKALQSRGYDAVKYSSGTLEAEELHIFGKTTAPPTGEIPPAPPVTEAGVPPKKPPKDWNKVKTDLWDRYNKAIPAPSTARPLSELFRGAYRQVEKATVDEFARLNRLGWQTEVDLAMARGASGRAAEIYRQAMVDIRKALQGRNDLLRYVDDYLLLRHQLEIFKATGRKTLTMIKGGLKSKFTDKQIQLLFAQMKDILGEDYTMVKVAAESVPKVYHELLRESEEVTPEMAEMLIERYPWYNPIIYETEGADVTINPSKLTPSTIKRLSEYNIDKRLETPLTVLPNSIRRRVMTNARNEARKSLAHDAINTLGDKVKIVDKKPDGAFIDFFENGERKYLELGEGMEWIAQDIELLQSQPRHITSRIAKAINNVSRAAFTSYNPAFLVSNALFDAVTAYFREGIYPWNLMEANYHTTRDMLLEDTQVNKFRTAGADVGGFFANENQMKERFVKVAKGGNLVIRNPKDWKRLLNPFELIKELGHAGENAPRLAVYKKAIKEGATPKEAALRARRVTVDFARMGTVSRFLNDWYIFFNAGVQGFMLPGRTLRDNPRSAWRLAVLIAGVIGLTAYNATHDEYKDVPNYIKYGTVHIMLPSNKYDKYGNKIPRYILLMPTTREFSLFFAPAVYMMEKINGNSPDHTGEFVKSWYPMFSPFSMITQTGGFEVPTQLAQSLNELSSNWDTYRNRPIVEDDLLDLPPGQQYDEYTSKTAIAVGRALNMSPKKLDYFVSNSFGALGRDVLYTIDRMVNEITVHEGGTRIAALVEELKAIPETVPPNEISLKRQEFLNNLSVEDRDLVLSLERLPEDRIPIISSIIGRVYKERGGQAYQTAKNKALEEARDMLLNGETEPPKDAIEDLQLAAVKNAQNLINKQISKQEYDDERSRYRAYYSGARSKEWQQAQRGGAVAGREVQEYMPEDYRWTPQEQALSDYFEIRQKYIDEAAILNSEAWGKIEQNVIVELSSKYTQTAVQYALDHKDDWIYDLPEPARTIEVNRAKAIEDETWWDDYRGASVPKVKISQPYEKPGTLQPPSFMNEPEYKPSGNKLKLPSFMK